MNKLNQWRASKRYQAKMNMLAKFERECAEQLKAMRQADMLLGDVAMGRPVGRVTCDMESGAMDKYGKVYTARTCGQLGDLASENDAVGASFLAGMDKAETVSRNIADNNL